jgi:hypothetical protein
MRTTSNTVWKAPFNSEQASIVARLRQWHPSYAHGARLPIPTEGSRSGMNGESAASRVNSSTHSRNNRVHDVGWVRVLPAAQLVMSFASGEAKEPTAISRRAHRASPCSCVSFTCSYGHTWVWQIRPPGSQ